MTCKHNKDELELQQTIKEDGYVVEKQYKCKECGKSVTWSYGSWVED